MEHEALASVLATVAREVAGLLDRRWRLSLPPDLAIHILTDGPDFVLATAPARVLWAVKLTRPLWRRRAERASALAGGLTLPWRGRPAVGVKPPEHQAREPKGLGSRLFHPVEEPMERVRLVVCHELTHAATAHLRLPPWLNEGLAMRATDLFAGHPTVREETRSLVEPDPARLPLRAYRFRARGDELELLRLYATGYWLTRWLDMHDRDALVEVLRGHGSHRHLGKRARKGWVR